MVCLSVLQELAADAADIVASSPSTLKQQLAQEGADLEADWAEAEASSAAALTTTGMWLVMVATQGPEWCMMVSLNGTHNDRCVD